MTAITADCSKEYRAVHNNGHRPISQIKWIALHDEESLTAESAAKWFTNHNSQGSAHLCVDDTICYRTLENDEIPWAAASSFGANLHGFHIEMGGYAKWTLGTWLLHDNTLRRAAFKAAQHCLFFKIPTTFVFAAGLLQGDEGITTHAEITKASKIDDPDNALHYNHTDPGLFFPRRKFMTYLRAYYANLAT